jgi:hypothetical protein
MCAAVGHEPCAGTLKECQIISSDIESGDILVMEVKSEEGSSDGDEAAFLRKLKSKNGGGTCK